MLVIHYDMTPIKIQLAILTRNLSNAVSLRMNKGKTFIRSGVDYTIIPKNKVENFISQISYRPNTKLSGDLKF